MASLRDSYGHGRQYNVLHKVIYTLSQPSSKKKQKNHIVICWKVSFIPISVQDKISYLDKYICSQNNYP